MNLYELLSAICTKVEAVKNTAATQEVFLLENLQEARLAFDVLLAHGFEVKFYEEQTGAKLYHVIPDDVAGKFEKKLALAYSYAQSIGTIKQSLDRLKHSAYSNIQSYNIAYTSPSVHGQDKRIVIDILAVETAPRKKTAAPASTKQQESIPAAISSSNKIKSKKITQDEIDASDFDAGPAVAKKSLYKIFKEQQKKIDQDTLYRQTVNFLKSQRATTTFWVVIYLAGLLSLYSFFIIVKAYLCPDLATVQKNVWYCSYNK